MQCRTSSSPRSEIKKRTSLFSFSGSTHTVAFRVFRFFFFFVLVGVSSAVVLSEVELSFVLSLLFCLFFAFLAAFLSAFVFEVFAKVMSSIPVVLIKPAELRVDELRDEGPEVVSVPSEPSSSSSEEESEEEFSSSELTWRGDGPGEDRLAGWYEFREGIMNRKGDRIESWGGGLSLKELSYGGTRLSARNCTALGLLSLLNGILPPKTRLGSLGGSTGGSN